MTKLGSAPPGGVAGSPNDTATNTADDRKNPGKDPNRADTSDASDELLNPHLRPPHGIQGSATEERTEQAKQVENDTGKSGTVQQHDLDDGKTIDKKKKTTD
jgi:hypothetical protein